MNDSEASLGRKVLSWCYAAMERSPFIRFLLLGTWNAIWSFGLFAFLVTVLQMNYLPAISIVWGIGFVVNYVANFLWVFRTDQRLRYRRNLRRYVILFLSSFAVNFMLLSLMVEIVHVPPLPAQFIVIPVVVLLNFFGGRLWAFRARD